MDLRTAAAYLGCSYWMLRDLERLAHDSHGLNTGTPARSYSRASRETTVIPWCNAVAAMNKSGCENVS